MPEKCSELYKINRVHGNLHPETVNIYISTALLFYFSYSLAQSFAHIVLYELTVYSTMLLKGLTKGCL